MSAVPEALPRSWPTTRRNASCKRTWRLRRFHRLLKQRRNDRLTCSPLRSRLGLTQPSRKGKDVLITPMPSAVELFTQFEPMRKDSKAKGAYLYRFYSGYAHAKQWALTLGAQRMAPFDTTGRTLALVSSNDEATVAATHRAMNAIERAV